MWRIQIVKVGKIRVFDAVIRGILMKSTKQQKAHRVGTFKNVG